MAFSDLFSPNIAQVGMNVLGSFQALDQYKSGLNSYYQNLRMQQDQMAQGLGMYMDASRQQQEYNDYMRQIEALNRLTMQNERNYAQGQYNNYLDQLLEERTYATDRQGLLDQDAARQRAMQLTEYLNNQNLTAQERRFALEQLRIAQDIAASERGERMDIYSSEADRLAERQMLADQEAKDIQLYRLREAARNRDLLASERAFAQQLLGTNAQIAADERQFELGRLAEDQQTAGDERQFVVDQYQQYLAQSQRERGDEMMIREMLMSGANDLQGKLEATAAELGYIPNIEQITPEMLDEEIARRTGEYQSDVDRAAQMVASSGEADLIRAGIDSSTIGTQRRGEIASRLAAEYQNARSKAYNDAVGYISGRSDAMAKNVSDIINRRKAILGETADIGSTEMGILQNLRALPSAAGAYQMAPQIQSAILNRNISSAGDYTSPVGVNSALYSSGLDAMSSGLSNYDYNLMNLISGVGSANTYSSPVAIGSAVYNGNMPGSAYAGTLSAPTAASTAYTNLPSTVLAPYAQQLTNPMTAYGNYTSAANSYGSALMGNYNSGVNALTSSSEAWGKMFRDLMNDGSQNNSNGQNDATGATNGWGTTTYNTASDWWNAAPWR